MTLPPVTFTGVDLANRVEPGRITRRWTGTGSRMSPPRPAAVIEVAYELAKPCSPGHAAVAVEQHLVVLPGVLAAVHSHPAPDWFIKYAGRSVDQTDPTGGSPGV